MSENQQDQRTPVSEEMWCYDCEHVWITTDYFGKNSCPKCKCANTYRTSSASCLYATFRKAKEKQSEN